MSGRDIDGAYCTSPEGLLEASIRRAALREAGRCINGPLGEPKRPTTIVHGPVVAGTGKCQRCIDVARRSR